MEHRYDSIGTRRLGYGIIAVVLRLATRERWGGRGGSETGISPVDTDGSRAGEGRDRGSVTRVIVPGEQICYTGARGSDSRWCVRAVPVDSLVYGCRGFVDPRREFWSGD
jgi:hypothetical protein